MRQIIKISGWRQHFPRQCRLIPLLVLVAFVLGILAPIGVKTSFALKKGELTHVSSPESSGAHAETESITKIPLQCIAEDFPSFLIAFSESVDNQKVFTRFPLERLRIDIDADPEPKPLLESITKEETKFPLMPNAKVRKAKGLTLRIDEQNAQRAKVTLLKEDTDFQVVYFFSREKCWMLVRVEDWSL